MAISDIVRSCAATVGGLAFSIGVVAQPCAPQFEKKLFTLEQLSQKFNNPLEAKLNFLRPDRALVSPVRDDLVRPPLAAQLQKILPAVDQLIPIDTLLSWQFQNAGVKSFQYYLTRGQEQDLNDALRSRGILEKIRSLKGMIESQGFNENSPNPLPAYLPQVKDENGCLRQAKFSDLNNVSKNLKFQMYYDGFNEVAMLAKLKAGSKQFVKHCSAVIIGSGHALTARHCFNGAQESDRYILLLGPPKPGVSVDNLNGCQQPPYATCPFKVLPLGKRISQSAENTTNPLDSNKFIETPDLALLSFERNNEDKSKWRYAKIKPVEELAKTQDGEDKSRWLTIVGFGLSDQASEHELSGGYWSSPTVITTTAGSLATLQNTENHQTRFCKGDSGGPLFLGAYTGGGRGMEEGARFVSGLMSQGLDIASRKECTKSPKSVVQLLTKEITTWICGQSNEIEGCK